MEDAKERLFKAAVAGDTEALEQLTDEHPADVIFSKRNDQGDLASHVALQHGNFRFAMKMCSYYPAALWELNGKGDGLLHMAAKLGHHQFFLHGARLLSQHFQRSGALLFFRRYRIRAIRSQKYRKRTRYNDVKLFSNSVVNGEDKSLLYMAAEKGYLEAAKLLLENKAYSIDMDRAYRGPDGSTALHIATRNRNYDMVQIFLQHGVPDSIITRQEVETGYTPFHIAVSLNEPRLAELFLTSHPSSANILDRDGFSPFHLAIRMNQTELMFQLFLRHSPDCCQTLTDKGQNALHIAVERNIEGVIEGVISVIVKDKRLSELMINQQDENGNTPLHIAVILNEPRLAEMFLTTLPSSANTLDGDGFSPLHLAVRMNKTEMFQLFLRQCPDCCKTLTDKGQNALHIAVAERNIEGVISVIVKDKGLSELMINQQDENGNTPLHIAVSLNEPRLAELFLTSHPSSANILGRDGFSPLHLAVQMNKTELMFQLFLRHCPDCCKTLTDKGQNALHIAVERNNEGVISVIVKDKRLSELMINQQDENGNTPLHLAAYRDDKKMQDTLLGCQAQVLLLMNNKELTFQEVAKHKPNADERLFKAADVGDMKFLEQLRAEHPAAVIIKIRNSQGELASHVALQRGHLEFATKMCSYFPAALWEHNGKGDSLLHMAAKLGHHEFFLKGARLLSQYLVYFHSTERFRNDDELQRDAGMARRNVVSGEDKSLLYMAAEKGYNEAAKLLLENKAYCDCEGAFAGPDGTTALHIATRNRNYVRRKNQRVQNQPEEQQDLTMASETIEYGGRLYTIVYADDEAGHVFVPPPRPAFIRLPHQFFAQVIQLYPPEDMFENDEEEDEWFENDEEDEELDDLQLDNLQI